MYKLVIRLSGLAIDSVAILRSVFKKMTSIWILRFLLIFGLTIKHGCSLDGVRLMSPLAVPVPDSRPIKVDTAKVALVRGNPVIRPPGNGGIYPIVGGSPLVNPQSYPWQVLIKVYGDFSCGGSLIHPCFVLTAKHCLIGLSPGDVSVILGDHKRSTPEPTEQHIAVNELIRHPNRDVAILQLASSAKLTNYVQIIPMAKSGPAIPSLATVTGWGQTESNKIYGGAQADVLQYLEISVVDKSKCEGEGIPVQSHQICAGKSNGPYSNACYGDSGGPLAQLQNGKWMLIGVVQGGRAGCPDNTNHAVYENVASSYSWVYSKLPKRKISTSSSKIFHLLSKLATVQKGPLTLLSQSCPA